MNESQINRGLLAFIDASPTPYHAVQTLAARLDQAGFERLHEQSAWQLQRGGRYYVTRNDSSIIAFKMGQKRVSEIGLRMIGAHTDSPCLKLKPEPDVSRKGFWQAGVEIYGGALLNPWFDRDLSLAGRVSYSTADEQVANALVDFKRPVATVPSLAIHLDREANKKRSINPQLHMPPVLALLENKDDADIRRVLADELASNGVDDVEQVLDFDICCYDTQPSAQIGLNQDFIAAARLDNLLSCYVGLEALLACDDEIPTLLVCNDHEEVGSASAAGAQGNFLGRLLEATCGEGRELDRAMAASMMISVDNAHGIHPNFADKHDGNHGPMLNQGPVIKTNASQRYATNSETSAIFRHLCQQQDVPVQSFVVRSDMGCGSTIGPITATEIGVRTLDIGVPTFAMHSIRELAGAKDPYYLWQSLVAFLNLESLLSGGLA